MEENNPDDCNELLQAGFAHVECINLPDTPLEEAMKKEVAQRNIRQTIQQICKLLKGEIWNINIL